MLSLATSPKVKTGTGNGFGSGFWMLGSQSRALAMAGAGWPAAKKLKTGTVSALDLAKRGTDSHRLIQPAQPALPTGPTGPAQRKFYYINAKTVPVFLF